MIHQAFDVEEFEAELTVPDSPRGVVLLIDGDRREIAPRRSNALAAYLSAAQYASCILDLSPHHGIALVADEERDEIETLVDRVVAATNAIRGERDLRGLRIGHIASGVGSAASMIVAASDPYMVQAIVTCDGRPDLAGIRLHKVVVPSLFLVTSGDRELWELNRWAQRRLSGATDLSEMAASSLDIPVAGNVGDVCARSTRWFDTHLVRGSQRSPRRSPFRTLVPGFSRSAPGSSAEADAISSR